MERRWVKASKPYLPLEGEDGGGWIGEGEGGRGEYKGGEDLREELWEKEERREGKEGGLISDFLAVVGYEDWRRRWDRCMKGNVEGRKKHVLVRTHPRISYSTERGIRNGSV